MGEHDVPVTATRDRTLLAMLLLHANRTTPTEQLIDAIWPTMTPHDARTLLQGCVSRLRKRFAKAGATGQIIITEPAGYRIAIDPDGLDLLDFRRLLAEARTANHSGKVEQATDLYRTALALWRGPALAGIDSPVVRQAATALDEEHIQAQEERFTAALATGSAGELVPELTELVQQHPHREGLHHALMLALYRGGRQADALAAYRHARQLLQDELGTEPGHDLQELHRAVLNRDAALEATRPSPPSTPPTPVPRELPADVAAFTGRTDAIETMDELLSNGQDTPGPVVISAIAGTAGVGKTALAIHWAHRVADQLPDGQLYINLRGYDPDQPLAPTDALARFLTALGVAGQDIPLELDQRAAQYRSQVAGRRMLVVLDNASSVEQVRPLLPGSGSCAVVVTSRDSLAGLVAVHGAHRLDLGLLSAAEAVALLRRLIGPRVDTEPDAATTLADQCARLPLALRVAAEIAVTRSAIPLAKLVVELDDQQQRLELLNAGGDPHAAVRVVFSWSIRHLPTDAACTFPLLGLHPGPDLDPYAAAALADTSVEQARRALDALARANLVHVTGPGRYGMHDLLRAFAVDLVATEDARQAALDRLFDYYLATAAAAMDRLHPAEAHRRPRIPAPITPAPALTDPGTARVWLDTERLVLVAAAAHAATRGWPSHAIWLSSTLFRYLDGGHYADGLTLHAHAQHAAEQAGDLAGQAHALRGLGTIHGRIGRWDTAADHLRRALVLYRQAGDLTGEGIALANLGAVEHWLGRYQSAIDRNQSAITLFRRVGDQTGEAFSLTNLGNIELRLGRYEPAAERYRRALALFQELGNPYGEAHALTNLGDAERELGWYEPAAERHRRALALFRDVGATEGEAHALNSLGSDHLGLNQPERATERLTEALILFREIGDKDGEADVLTSLGEAALVAGRPADALTLHADALTVAVEIGSRDPQARAHTGLGHTYRALRDHARARAHYEQAVVLYTDLGMPKAEDVRAHIVDLQRSPRLCSGSFADVAEACH